MFAYSTDRGCIASLIVVSSISVYAWCIGDDFVYVDQYCSCSISIAYRFMSGSLSMPCVCSRLLYKLFCSIPSCVPITMYSDGVSNSIVFLLVP